jgi:MFS family permease
MTSGAALPVTAKSLRRMLLPLALAQFICSFAGSNMNVMINDISHDLNTTVQGVQVCITLFLLVMAALMIPCGKLTDRWGRKRCFMIGLMVYGVGAVLSAVSPSLGVLILGNSILEGVGTALLIPPVYILTTMLFHDMKSRARAFGVVSGMGGIGAATGPLIGGAITTEFSWRVAFIFQALIIVIIVVLARNVVDPVPADPSRPFDTVGAILSAVGLVVLVGGIMAADQNLVLMVVLMVAGALVLAGFFVWVRRRERAGKEVLLSTSLFRNRTSNLALVTQNVQWAVLMGTSFVVSAYLQVVRKYDAIQTGVIFTAATVGILLSSLAAGRLARRFRQRTLILAGFVTTIVGIIALLVLVKGHPGAWYFAPGLFLIGVGLGVMLTPSVNVVQSAFPENLQGEISGLSRSVSNLGSSFGTAIAGTILVAGLAEPTRSYGIAMVVLGLIGLIGLAATFRLPAAEPAPETGVPAPAAEHTPRLGGHRGPRLGLDLAHRPEIGHGADGCVTRCTSVISSPRPTTRSTSPGRAAWSGSSARSVVVSGLVMTSQSSNCARSVLPAGPLKLMSYVSSRTGNTPRSQ